MDINIDICHICLEKKVEFNKLNICNNLDCDGYICNDCWNDIYENNINKCPICYTNLEDNIIITENNYSLELDINIKLDIINTFIIDIHNSDKIFNESINKTFKYLEEILKTIELEIENINNELLFYEQIWFRKFRKCNYTIMINNLVKHVKLLDSRFELLIKLIKI